MLRDEEKKAIDLLKNIDMQKCLMLECPVVKNNIERQLKIIELNRINRKQSKEIEELKERYERANKRYLKSLQEKDDKCEKLLEYVETEKETDYISKDKIKAKIEEIKEEVKTCFIYGKAGCCTNNCKEACFYYDVIDILQRLLEEK